MRRGRKNRDATTFARQKGPKHGISAGELDHFTCFSTVFSTGVEILGGETERGLEARCMETPDEDARAL
jgi:hypothetical protein